MMAPREQKAVPSKTLDHQRRNEQPFRHRGSHHLALTKNDEEPTSFTLVGNSADSRGPTV